MVAAATAAVLVMKAVAAAEASTSSRCSAMASTPTASATGTPRWAMSTWRDLADRPEQAADRGGQDQRGRAGVARVLAQTTHEPPAVVSTVREALGSPATSAAATSTAPRARSRVAASAAMASTATTTDQSGTG